MRQDDATKLLREEMDKHGLSDWHIRLTTDITRPYLGLCSYKDKTIILNAHHLDTHPEPEILNTIRHEIAHALLPSIHGHDDVWRKKALEVGCTSAQPCSHLSFSSEVIDAIRSGATLQVEYETEVIHRPKYTISKLQDKCPTCGKIAKEKSSYEKDGKKYIFLECFHIIIKDIPKSTPFDAVVSNDWKPEVSKCKHQWNPSKKTQCLLCGEFRLYPFQIEGARFIERGLAIQKGAGVFDEMGLGKTVQSLAYLKLHPESLPALFVVKSGIKFQWYKEIIRWIGINAVPQVINTGKDGIIPGLKAYVISYDMLRRFDTAKIKQLGIKTVIMDEVQQIKNPDSTRTQEVRNVVRDIPHVIPLSGTPWKNRGSEFFVALNMLDPMKFDSHRRFLLNWVDYYYDGARTKEGGIKNPKKFKEYTKDIIIRRERAEVMPELPLINRVRLYCEMEATAQKAYDDEVSEFVKYYNEKIIGGEEDSFETSQHVLARLSRMRHITGLAKIPVTLDAVDEFITETDRKLVVFVHHKDVGEILLNEIKRLESIGDIPVYQLHSGLNSEQRFELQEKFNKIPRAILIASTLASGEGLNLQTCSDCIMHERQWNPANEEQAEGRFIRIGQVSNSVTAKYALANGSVDELFDGIVEKKRVQFHVTMNNSEVSKWNEQSIIKELSQAIINMDKKGRK